MEPDHIIARQFVIPTQTVAEKIVVKERRDAAERVDITWDDASSEPVTFTLSRDQWLALLTLGNQYGTNTVRFMQKEDFECDQERSAL